MIHLEKVFPAFIILLKEGMANSKGFPELTFNDFYDLCKKLGKACTLSKKEFIELKHQHQHNHEHSEEKKFESPTKDLEGVAVDFDVNSKDFKARVELLFIRCTRNKENSRLKAFMCRSELMEAIIRLATTIFYPEVSHHNPVKAVNILIEKHLWPFAHSNEQYTVRNIILRSDTNLNDFLYDNRALTKALYLYWRGNDGFRVRNAFLMFNFNGTRE